MTPRLKKILGWTGFFAFYVFSLFLFARLTFPYERVKDRIVQEFDRRQTGPDAKRLEIEDVSGHWLFGIEAEGIRLLPKNPKPPEPEEKEKKSGKKSAKKKSSKNGEEAEEPAGEAASKKPEGLAVDSLSASVSVLRMIFGTLSVSFDVEVGGGEIAGSYLLSDEVSELELEVEEVSVAGLSILEDLVELPLEGTLAGNVAFVMPEAKLQNANGSIELTIDGLAVGDGKAKIRETIALPKLQAGQLKLLATATEGRLDLTDFSASGPDFQLTSDGSIRLREPVEASLADLRVRFQFKDKYKSKNDLTKGLFGAPDSNVPGLFDLDPKIKRAKDSEGFYGWRASGPLSRLNFLPSASNTSSSRRGPWQDMSTGASMLAGASKVR
jgi:type II secretion system protein N